MVNMKWFLGLVSTFFIVNTISSIIPKEGMAETEAGSFDIEELRQKILPRTHLFGIITN